MWKILVFLIARQEHSQISVPEVVCGSPLVLESDWGYQELGIYYVCFTKKDCMSTDFENSVNNHCYYEINFFVVQRSGS